MTDFFANSRRFSAAFGNATLLGAFLSSLVATLTLTTSVSTPGVQTVQQVHLTAADGPLGPQPTGRVTFRHLACNRSAENDTLTLEARLPPRVDVVSVELYEDVDTNGRLSGGDVPLDRGDDGRLQSRLLLPEECLDVLVIVEMASHVELTGSLGLDLHVTSNREPSATASARDEFDLDRWQLFGPAEICDNGIDDDAPPDGRVDEFDSNCIAANTCEIPRPTAQPTAFTALRRCTVGGSTGYEVPVAGDVDGDGLSEILSTQGNEIIVMDPIDSDGDTTCDEVAITLNDGTPVGNGRDGGAVIGDVDNDGTPDIFLQANNGDTLYRFEWDGATFVQIYPDGSGTGAGEGVTTGLPNTHPDHIGDGNYREGISIQDLDQDGVPEIIPRIGWVVNAVTGEVHDGSGAVPASQVPVCGRKFGQGMFAFAKEADSVTNANGLLELVCGGHVFTWTTVAGWTEIQTLVIDLNGGGQDASDDQAISAGGTSPNANNDDAFYRANTSVADLDNDGDVDALVVDEPSGRVFVWDLQTAALVPGGGPSDYGNAGGGPAAIGNFDDDPTTPGVVEDPCPEFVFINDAEVRVYDDICSTPLVDGDGPLIWQVAHLDPSGHTQMALFDFDGEGIYEIVYRDNNTLRIFQSAPDDGGGGPVTYFDSFADTGLNCTSGTGYEHPTIGDFDRDGSVELAVTCDGRLELWEPGPNTLWLPGRDIWNQTQYKGTNVYEDGSIPQELTENYRLFNHYHAQITDTNTGGLVLPTDPNIPTPDAVANSLVLTTPPVDCGAIPANIDVDVEICINGEVNARDFAIQYYDGDPTAGAATYLASFSTGMTLDAGTCMTFTHSVPIAGVPRDLNVVINNDDDDTDMDGMVAFNLGTIRFQECDFTNNVRALNICMVMDSDGDTITDDIDIDDDNDGILDTDEGDGAVDTDMDGTPDSLDLDSDNDGIFDVQESGLIDADDAAGDGDAADADGDGRLDGVPADFGANGLLDDIETAAESGDPDYDNDAAGPDAVADTDGDGTPDFRDVDSDNDGISDLAEGDTGLTDADNDGDDDAGVGGATTMVPDTDMDGIPDYRDLDADGDGINDVDEAGGPVTDADGDGLSDGAVITSMPAASDADGADDYRDLDSNGDGTNDVDDSGFGDLDIDMDGVIDVTTDTDGDGIVDPVDGDDAAYGDTNDADGDGVPDANEVLGGLDPIDADTDDDGLSDGEEDTNGNGVQDAGETSALDDDTDMDGLQDGTEVGDTMPVADPDGPGPLMGTGAGYIPDADPGTTTDPLAMDTDMGGVSDGAEDTNANGQVDPGERDPNNMADDLDQDMDGIPDVTDIDDDNDGILDVDEGDGAVDTDMDGTPDSLDLDSDNDGIYDVQESGLIDADDAAGDGDAADADGDGMLDGAVGANGLNDAIETVPESGDPDYDNDGAGPDAVFDTDTDGTPDFRDVDSDNDGITDLAEGDTGLNDIDDNGIDDFGMGEDTTTVPDTDMDGIPDYRDLDSDNDGINDVDEAGGAIMDADGDGESDGGTLTSNPAASDADGVDDYRDVDSDGDGTNDIEDSGFGALDIDMDGVIDDTTDT
ncbi:MAG: hypothetical protein AAF533_15720, partial [Acidobacteriota bacterium]